MFRFKQFTIFQERCAMKVCTDACVLGAWAGVESAQYILDIGTGTGLLALMAAQRSSSVKQITALEIDSVAFEQASENSRNSPFHSLINVQNVAVQDFIPPILGYDYVICNPPFYENQMLSPQFKTNQAHHSVSLRHSELIAAVARLLKPDGTLGVLLPLAQSKTFSLEAIKMGLQTKRNLFLRHNAQKPVFRVLTEYCFGETLEKTTETLDIYDTEHPNYTAAFRSLLKDFYLIF